MSDLGDAVERMVTGGGGGREPSLTDYLRDARARYGSNRAAARALGVNESVFRRAINGQTAAPKLGLRGAVEREAREHSRRSGFTNADIRLTITDRAPGRGGRVRRDREIGATNLKITDAGAAGRIGDAYVAGGKEAAARQLLREVGDAHYARWLVPEDWEGAESDYGYSVS